MELGSCEYAAACPSGGLFYFLSWDPNLVVVYGIIAFEMIFVVAIIAAFCLGRRQILT